MLDANDRAKELGEFDILTSILGGKFHFFVAVTSMDYIGAMTVEIQHYPLVTVAQIVHLGSKDFDLMQTELPKLETWAREQGANKLRMHGRRGFEKILLPLGFHPRYYVMEKEI